MSSKSSNSLISVIVPIYNAEKYLDECLGSIVSQTYENLEIVLVDDKSPDNSGRIADQWARDDKRIKVIHKKQNEGINPARKTGFENSSGEYVMFVDDDDIIHKNLAKDHFKAISGSGADVSISKAYWWNDGDAPDTEQIYQQGSRETKILNKKLSYRSLITETSPFSNSEVGMLWNKLHKRSFFKDYNWELSNIPAEDFMTNAYLFDRVKSVVYIDCFHYFHRMNLISTMQQLKNKGGANAKQKVDIFDALFQVAEVFQEKSIANGWDFSKEILYFKYRYFFIRTNAFISGNSFTEEDFLKLKKYAPVAKLSEFLSGDFSRYLSEYIYQPATEIYSSQLVDFWRIFLESETLAMFLEKRLNGLQALLSEKESNINGLNNNINHISAQLVYLQSLKGSMFNFLGKIKHRVIMRFLHIPRHIGNYIVSERLNKKYKNCWLVMDREESASDNGYWYYRFLQQNHPEINAYFAINQDSPDVPKLQELGFRLVFIGSKEHQLAIKNSVNLLYAYYTFEHSNETARRIFLQHGIAKDNLPNPGIRPFDYWLTSIQKEQESYAERVDITAIKIGLSRYEVLLRKVKEYSGTKNKIVIAPTWRPWLYSDAAKIKQSAYYQNWQKFLQSKELKDLAKEFEITFILHPMMKNISTINEISIFDIPDNVKSTAYDELGAEGLQDLLLGTNLTITDFSSIPFDSALCGSNVVYFQFDKTDYYTKGHMRPSWFEYERDGFGPVYYNYNEFISYVKTYNGKSSQQYQQRSSSLRNEIFASGDISERITKLAKDEL